MKKCNSHQRGFSIVEMVIAVALIALIGSAGYYALSARQAATNQPSSTPSVAPSSSIAAPKLTLSDWGVSASLAGSKNIFTTTKNGEYYKVYNAEVSQLCSDTTFATGSVERALLTEKTPGQTTTYAEYYKTETGGTDFNKWKIIGKYIYLFNSPQTACAKLAGTDGKASDASTKLNDITKDFVSLSAQLKADSN